MREAGPDGIFGLRKRLETETTARLVSAPRFIAAQVDESTVRNCPSRPPMVVELRAGTGERPADVCQVHAEANAAASIAPPPFPLPTSNAE
jgi:hypothetical protein